MELDARRTTHPIQRPIANESQANDAFDVVSYQKGQSFLRMLEAYLGPDIFRDGIRRYMAKHQLSSTTTADLWAALGDASGKPVIALAAGWTEQPGFPVVLVSASGESPARALKLEQLRFTLNYPAAVPLAWKIPVTVANTAALDAPADTLLEGRTATVPWPAGAGTAKINVGDTGYYRTLYDASLTAALRREIPTLPVADQLNLLADTWALVEAARTPAPSWLALAEQLRASRSQPVVSLLLDRLGAIESLQRAAPGRRAFQTWVVQLLSPQLARLTWDALPGESPLDGTLRARLISMLGYCGDRAVIAECTRRFDAFLKDPATLAGNLRGPVLVVVGRYATRDTYEKLHTLARTSLTTEDKRNAYAGMQAAQDPALVRETLALSLGTEMSVTESTHNVAAIARNGHAELAWNFARANMDALLKQVTFFGRNTYIPDILGAFTDTARADELEDYVRKNSPPDALAEAAKTADRIRHLAGVKQRELAGIDAWVKERVKLPE